MAGSAFRFLQSSDLDLHRPLSALSGVPEELRNECADSPFLAAERVFDLALAERVDFLLLAGNVCDPRRAGARGLVFLIQQFERLEQNGIPIFWCHGNDDRVKRWPLAMKWPDNLHRFAVPAPEAHYHTTEDGMTVEIIGNSWTRRAVKPAAPINSSGDGVFTIALTGQKASKSAAAETDPHWWALGGSKNRQTTDSNGSIAHWAGSPQGRSPSETGSHGCTIVEVDHDRECVIHQHDCDLVRWADVEVEIQASWNRQDIVRAMRAKASELSSSHVDRIAVATWDLGTVPSSILDHRLRPNSAEWISEMQVELRQGNSNIIMAGLHWDTPFDETGIDEESLRGSFLRCLRALLDEKQVAAILRGSIPADLPPELAKKLSSEDAATIAMLVDQTASLGDALLDAADRCHAPPPDELEAA